MTLAGRVGECSGWHDCLILSHFALYRYLCLGVWVASNGVHTLSFRARAIYRREVGHKGLSTGIDSYYEFKPYCDAPPFLTHFLEKRQSLVS